MFNFFILIIMKKDFLKKFDKAIAVGGLSIACVACCFLAGWFFFEPVGNSDLAFWGVLFLQVLLFGVAVFCIYRIFRFFEKKREARLLEEEKRTGIKLL